MKVQRLTAITLSAALWAALSWVLVSADMKLPPLDGERASNLRQAGDQPGPAPVDEPANSSPPGPIPLGADAGPASGMPARGEA